MLFIFLKKEQNTLSCLCESDCIVCFDTVYICYNFQKKRVFIDVLIPLVIQGLRNCFLLREDISLSGANLFVKLLNFL